MFTNNIIYAHLKIYYNQNEIINILKCKHLSRMFIVGFNILPCGETIC